MFPAVSYKFNIFLFTNSLMNNMEYIILITKYLSNNSKEKAERK
jgi:hypothetical protein